MTMARRLSMPPAPTAASIPTARDLLAWENALRDATVLDASLRDLAYRPR